MLRWLTAGESHGPALSAIIEGMPAHVLITSKDIDIDLSRRRLGFGRGARQNFEADKITITGGIRHGKTQGGPIAIQIANSEWPKWEKIMSADPVPDEEIKDLARNAPLTRPRPGHAVLVGMQSLISQMPDRFWSEQAPGKQLPVLHLELLPELFLNKVSVLKF